MQRGEGVTRFSEKEFFLYQLVVRWEGIIRFFKRKMDLERLDAVSLMRSRNITDYSPLKRAVGERMRVIIRRFAIDRTEDATYRR